LSEALGYRWDKNFDGGAYSWGRVDGDLAIEEGKYFPYNG
jgi:hypothetical protein